MRYGRRHIGFATHCPAIATSFRERVKAENFDLGPLDDEEVYSLLHQHTDQVLDRATGDEACDYIDSGLWQLPPFVAVMQGWKAPELPREHYLALLCPQLWMSYWDEQDPAYCASFRTSRGEPSPVPAKELAPKYLEWALPLLKEMPADLLHSAIFEGFQQVPFKDWELPDMDAKEVHALLAPSLLREFDAFVEKGGFDFPGAVGSADPTATELLSEMYTRYVKLKLPTLSAEEREAVIHEGLLEQRKKSPAS